MKISIVIPAYNEENDIEECLNAVAAQERPADEVIVVDNNSTDNTVEVVKKYPFVRLITAEKQGVSHARDAGFDAATGDVIGRIDVDTHMPTNWTKQVERIFSDPEIMAATGPVFYTDLPAQQMMQDLDTMLRSVAYNSGMKFLFGTNMAIRKVAWDKVNGKVCHDRRDIHEDLDLAIHLSEQNLQVAFDKDMVVGASTRRLNDNVHSFYKYVAMNNFTYRAHGINSNTAKVSVVAGIMMYPALKLLRKAYDPEQKRLSVKKLLQESEEARKHPMA